MNNLFARSLLPLFAALSLYSQEPPTSAAPSETRPSYLPLRYDEDWSVLREPALRSDRFDPLKFISLSADGGQYLTIGGEIRETYERFHNPDFGLSPQDPDGYLLQRYLLDADLHLGPRFRFFAQLQSALENGRTGGPRRVVDEDQLGVNQAFFDVNFGRERRPSFVLRVGRQELAFGSGRLVSRREGTNVLLSFDGVRFTARPGDWTVDGFATRPVNTTPGIFGDVPDHMRAFWGVYASRPAHWWSGSHIDLYYLGLARKVARFNQGVGPEVRHSLGARLWGQTESWAYDGEAIYQTGTFGSGLITAWRVASDTAYKFHIPRWSPRLGLKADVASGDRDPKNPDLQTFNALFQSGLYTGKAGILGPANTIVLEPSFALHLSRSVSVTGGYGFYWRQSLGDGLYDIAGNVYRPALNRNRYEGSRPIAEILWQVDRHLAVQCQYTYVFVGPFGQTPPRSPDLSYVAVWFTYKF